MRIGWLADPSPFKGGAEHECDELLRDAPSWVEIIPCPADEVRRDVDAYVIHNCTCYTAAAIKALEGKPVIKRVHDAWEVADPVLREWILANAAQVLFSGPLHRDQFRWSVNAPVSFVPSTIEASRFRVAAENQQRQGAIWLGRLYPGKGLSLAATWARENDTQIDVYGFGALAQHLPDGLRYCGEAAPEEVPALLARYETFVFLPDAVEPFGRGAAEAWLAGCKLVLNENVGALWWIKNDQPAIEQGADRFWQLVKETVSEYPYASHLPVLRALGQYLPIRHVVEFGAGKYSTLAFVSPTLYPTAVQVTSVEDDGDWLMQVQTMVVKAKQDAKWRPVYTPRPMSELVNETKIDTFDLVFIDNGRLAAERIPVIEAVAAAKPSALVVIHDFEVQAYQQAAVTFEHQYIYTRSLPWTAVLWNGHRPEVEAFIEHLLLA